MTTPDSSSSPRASTARWHAMPADDVAHRLEGDFIGLTSEEAELRLARYGPNELKQEPEATVLEMAIDQFRSPLILLLVAAGAIMLAVGDPVDTGVILMVVAINGVIGFFQERQAARSVQALRALLSATARCLRDGAIVEIDATQLVPGDIVILESGTRVPADLRMLAVTGLLVDESLLTGESVPVQKSTEPLPANFALADMTNMAFAGTSVARGRGRGLVVATGDATELGGIAGEMREVERHATPLQQRLDRLARVVGIAVAISAVFAFFAGVAAGRSTSEMFLVAVAVAVSAVPEGLPIAFTITLAVGVRHMSRRNAIVRRLPVVETLGSTTVIGSDKTGTLTENRMTVQTIWTADESVAIESIEPVALPAEDGASALSAMPPWLATALSGVLTNEATLSVDGSTGSQTGDPTEVALLVAGAKAGIDPDVTRSRFPLVVDFPFEPDRAWSASIRRAGQDHVLFVKGAPERVIEACATMTRNGEVVPIDRERAHHAANALASRGHRVLAMAFGPIDPADSIERVDQLSVPLTLAGFESMIDPPRQGAREAIAACRAAGVRTIMITGDHRTTAEAISTQLGLGRDNSPVLTGLELSAMSQSELEQAVQGVDIFARVTPEQKLEIIRQLQQQGEVVAVTGDGVNDAPALRASDIGVAMGKRGTDVAREASDMVLADDNFVSIVAAVEEGRTTYDNVRKVISFLFTTNAAEILIIVAALLLNWPLPMIAVQILWLNLVTDSLQVMALAFEPGEPDVMTRPPLGRDAGVLTRTLWQRIGLSGIVMTAATLALFKWELDHGDGEKTAQTLALTTLVLFQMFQAFNSRSERRSLFRLPFFGNRFLVIAVAVSILIHAAALYLPATQYLLRVEPLSLQQWGLGIAVAASIIVTVELHKAMLNLRR